MVTNRRTVSQSTVTQQIQLPIWPSDVRGLPNAFARCALFNNTNLRAGERKNYKRKVIAALRGISITYTGEELRQDDEDVFMQMLHIARVHELGTKVYFTGHSMLKDLHWSTSKLGYKRLVDCLDRLNATSLTMEIDSVGKKMAYSGSLIRSFRWKEEGSDSPMREWEIELEPEIIALFGSESYTRVDWALRLTLAPTEKWLHSFYHSHRDPYPFKVSKLHELMDSNVEKMNHFRYKLKGALQNLQNAGFLESFNIDTKSDLVHVVRKGRIGHSEMQSIGKDMGAAAA